MQLVLREFLHPRLWKPLEDPKFAFDAEQINSLCEVAEQVFKSEPSVLRLKGMPVCQPPKSRGITMRPLLKDPQ